ncbi:MULTISPECIES: hypothetical protein [Bradyrhizobium]|uniref:hypothetical protein n=1 Tax=Bradyrhizobium TaxID=374 RepID=UPI0010B81C67|nr:MULTISPECIES: hypothetical protein [Bradyrhizobium]MCC8936855.1 hypothetical protein [Bradyrhizobium ivorense]QOZ23154.1 hypothetical protein XH93_05395 [Bradyrhizobium sp. CCBAU 51753]VIO80861.1 hypothetical protein CI41S_75680 [Bradyrhizobium ivorense]
MNQKIKFLSLVAASVMATTAGAYAQGYYGSSWDQEYAYSGPRYYTAQPDVMYQPAPGYYGAYNGARHPTPSSTQGDVGPSGNNNGTLTGVYRRW